ncbi:MAG: hypothetical protein AAGA34_09140 [Pseudomonadota bacterium]
MKREARRLSLARRQTLLAEVSHRAAMLSLANALAEEARSQTLAERSRDLVRAYGGRSQANDGEALSQTGRFAAALGSLAHDAEQARADASQQATWHVEALGQAQTKARRQSERLEEARAAYQDAKERRLEEPHTGRAFADPRRLARDVHSNEPDPPSAENGHARTAQ